MFLDQRLEAGLFIDVCQASIAVPFNPRFNIRLISLSTGKDPAWTEANLIKPRLKSAALGR